MAEQQYTPRLKSLYLDKIRAELQEQFKYTNEMQIPRLDKVVINMGIGEATGDSKKPAVAAEDLGLISGQKAVVTRARNSIAGFKVRENMPIGAKVTLRKIRMYEFLDRLVNIALPRVRDFRGLNPKSFDGRGNYSLGIREHLVFPEINYDKAEQIWGMDVIIATTAMSRIANPMVIGPARQMVRADCAMGVQRSSRSAPRLRARTTTACRNPTGRVGTGSGSADGIEFA